MEKKVMVHFGKALARAVEIVERHEGTILANYGQSMLVRTGDDGLQALRDARYRVRELPERPTVRVAGFELDTTAPSGLSTSAIAVEAAPPSGRSHHIVRLAGPMHPDWKARLERMGVVVDQNLGDDKYLVGVDSAKVDDLQGLAFVDAVSPYYPAMKINPTLLTPEIQGALPMVAALSPLEPEATREAVPSPPVGTLRFTGAHPAPPVYEEQEGNLEIVLFDGEDPLVVVDALRALGASVIRSTSQSIIIYAGMQLAPQIAAIPQVREVAPYRPPALTNNVATGIIRVDVLHDSSGLDGSGQVVAIADTGLDTGVNDATMHDDFEGRIVAIHTLGRVGDASDIHNHGTHVAGSVLGNGANSNGRIQGMAPAARLVFQSTMDANRGLGGLPADLRLGLFDVARNDGAHIHTNSWSQSRTDGAYLPRSIQTDDFAFNNRQFLILISAGNDAPLRVNSPGNAKNALTVGASESVRPLPASVQFPNSPTFPPADFPGGPVLPGIGAGADNQNEVAGFSCPGPVQNNRRKPDVVAPGTWILSTRSSVSTYDSGPDGLGPEEVPPTGTGDEDGVWTHAEAVAFGLPGQPILRAGDQDTPAVPAGSGAGAADQYCYMGGTSMSTPIAAGSCALVRQYLIEQRGHTPSAALLKALIVNGAVDMGMGIPDDEQGWGRLDLANTLFPPGTNHVQFDDRLENAVRSGDINTYDVWASSAHPLAVTLVWRDPAGSTIQNELHLRVIHVDSGTESTSDDIADIRNNVQKVVLAPPQEGQYRIEVEGVNVTTAVPELSMLPQPRQDYALVVAGAIGFSCNPSDIVQVIDRSGSMGSSGYMDPAKERARQMVDILRINDHTGIVSFAASATEDMALTAINSQDDKDDAHAAIGLIHSAGMTDLREALQQGLDTLGEDTGRPRAMVFLSDGKHTVATPEIDDPFLDSVAAANVRVYTIALGPASDFDVLNDIASRTGTGAVHTVESAADLHKLHEIYYDIVGAIGCGFVTHLSSATLGAGGELRRSAAVDESVREAFFAASWSRADAEIEFALHAPSGKVYHPDSGGVLYCQGSTHAFYRVSRPEVGIWQLVVGHSGGGGNQPLWITMAAMADSDAQCEVKLDPRYLYENKILVRLYAHHNGRPLTGGKAVASIVYPTQSIGGLLERYAAELKEIELDPDGLAGDADDPDLMKLGILAARYGLEGKDIFERNRTKVELRDDGREQDPKADDGIYTAFFDPKLAGIAGNYQIQVSFEVDDEKLGTLAYTKLIPVHVPRPDGGGDALVIENIFALQIPFWRYVIIGARVLKDDGSPAPPHDGTSVDMTLAQGFRRVKSGDLPHLRRGSYYVWRLDRRAEGLRRGAATVTVHAKLDGTVVAAASRPIRL
ncbi:MAG: S8 family serine peptidase [Planctomycetota bacterium]